MNEINEDTNDLQAKIQEVLNKLKLLPTLGDGAYGRHSDLAELRRKLYEQVVDLHFNLRDLSSGVNNDSAQSLARKIERFEKEYNDLEEKVSKELSNEISIVLQQIDNKKDNKPQNLPYEPEAYLSKLKEAVKIYGVDLNRDVSKKLSEFEKKQSKRRTPLVSKNKRKGVFSLIKDLIKYIKKNITSLSQRTAKKVEPKIKK